MIDLTQIFSELGIVSGNTNSNNQFEFYSNIEFDDGTITTNQYEFFKKIGMSRYEFFKQYGGEKEFYQNIQELDGSEQNPNIFNYRTFYQNAGEYFGSSGGGSGPEFIIKVNSGSNGGFLIGTNPSLTYDYNLTTSDGQTILNQTGNYEIIFPNTDTDYIVEITGAFPHMVNGPSNPDAHKIQDVLQWGNQPWASMESMFYGCSELYSFSSTDIPDLTNVTNMSDMFFQSSFNGDISDWDVSNVTDMYRMFGVSPFNQNISNWDVSSVTNMRAMFIDMPFNQDISNWNVSNVTNMQQMFRNTPFNHDISNWDVSNVTNMGSMFQGSSFNQNIGNWDVSNVTNMYSMFQNATSFNQDLSSWCVQNFPSLPSGFDTGASSWTLPRPIWGTCPP